MSTVYNLKQAAHFLRLVPTLEYIKRNVLVSLATAAFSIASLVVTVFFILPFSLFCIFIPRQMLMPHGESQRDKNGRKVVAIVGGSRDIGLAILKQYSREPKTVIVVISRSNGLVQPTLDQLGATPAIIRCEELNLTAPWTQVAEGLKGIDERYGPITRLYVISGKVNQYDNTDVSGYTMHSMTESILANISGTSVSVLVFFDIMKSRGCGNICIVGPIPRVLTPANMVSYVSTKAFITEFSNTLRAVGAAHGVEVVTFLPSSLNGHDNVGPKGIKAMAKHAKNAIEVGGEGVVYWPPSQGVVMSGLEGVNPICQEIGKQVLMSANMRRKG